MNLIRFIARNVAIIVFIVLFLIACQERGADVVLLDKLDKTFDVSKFYRPKIRKSQQILSIDFKHMDKNQIKEAFGTAIFRRDTLAIYPSEGSLPTPYYVESTSGWATRNLKPIKFFGYCYKTIAYHEEKDTVAILHGIPFPSVAMAESMDGKFAYLSASKTSKNKKDYQDIKSFLQANFTPLKVEENIESERCGWENNDFLYFLSKKNKNEEVIFSFGEEDDSPKVTSITTILLEIFNKEYIQEMIKDQVYLPPYIPTHTRAE